MSRSRSMRWIQLALGAILMPALLIGQTQRASVVVALPAQASLASEGPLVSTENIIADGAIQDRMRNGFPARLHFRLERWSAEGMLNNLEATSEWDVIVRYDALNRRYEVIRQVGKHAARWSFDSIHGAENLLERPYRVDISPPKAGQKSYYSVALDVETMSLSDLDELERWLKGDLTPAVHGKRNPANVLTRGVRTLFLRLLGGKQRHYEARSSTFVP